MPSFTSPDPRNYLVGKGIVSWKGTLDVSYRDLGNAGQFNFTPNFPLLQHYSSRTGTKFKDQVAIQQKEYSFALQLDEFTLDNLKLMLLSSEPTTGHIEISDLDLARGALRFVGTNDVGPKYQVDLPLSVLSPSKAVDWISDGYAMLEIAGEILGDPVTGSFGTITPL